MKDGRILEGQTNAVLEMASFRLLDSGTYQVVVTEGTNLAISVPVPLVARGIQLLAWGKNEDGQLGIPVGSGTNRPGVVMEDVAAVSSGGAHSLFIQADGTLWGTGRLGVGKLPDGRSPIRVATNVVSVACGAGHSLFLKRDGSLWAMGYNVHGQLGLGYASNVGPEQPELVATNVVSAAAGHMHSVYVTADGVLWAMGENASGQLGVGSNLTQTKPVRVKSRVVAAACGGYFTHFLQDDGSLWGMGQNIYGQLGLGSSDYNPHPVPSQFASGVVAVTAGYHHAAYLRRGGDVWALGNNYYGQLGNGVVTDAATPEPFRLASGVVSVSAGGATTHYVRGDGSLWSVGWNLAGTLGLGDFVDRSRPEAVPDVLAASVHATAMAHHAFALGRVLLPSSPVFTVQPSGATVAIGETFTASVSIEAYPKPSLQWFRDGVPMPGATNAILVITNVQPPRIGDYQVIAANALGSVTSSVASLDLKGVNAGIWKGLVAYYAFDGDASDTTGNGNDGIPFLASYGPGWKGNGNQSLVLTNKLDGGIPWTRVSHIRLPTDLINGVSTEGTFVLWVYPFNGVGGLIGKAQPTVGSSPVFTYGGYSMTTGWSESGDPGRVYFRPNNSSPLLASKALLSVSNWNHVVLAYSPTGVRLFLNGKLDSSMDGNFSIAMTQPPPQYNAFGAYLWDNDGHFPNLYANGRFDDFRIYKRPLSDAEVTTLFAEDTALGITTQPVPQVANIGDTVSFSLSATHATAFQWLKDGTPLSGATNATLTLTNVQPPRIGDYQAVAGNGFGSVTSSVASLELSGVNAGIWKGLVAYFPFNGDARDASGWGRDGRVQGALLAPDRFGHQDKAFRFESGSQISVTNPRDGTFDFESDITISAWVSADTVSRVNIMPIAALDVGPGPQPKWIFGIWPQLVDGVTGAALGGLGFDSSVISPRRHQVSQGLNAFSGSGFRHCLVTKRKGLASFYVDGVLACSEDMADITQLVPASDFTIGWAEAPSSIESFPGTIDDLRVYRRALSEAEVTALYASELPPAVSVVYPPVSVTALVGGTATLSVGATNALGYQWFKDGGLVSRGTNATLVLGNLLLSDAGSYWAVVSNTMGRATSAPAVVVVQMPPTFVSQPLDTTVAPGGSITLNASVASIPPSALQWLRDDVPIPGATGESLVLGNVPVAGMGSYRLVASNALGSVSSRVARVSVTGADPAIWSGLIAYLPFNGSVFDEGAWRHPLVQQGSSLATDRRGRANAALAFNGAGDFVEILDHPALVATNYSVALWFNPVRRAGTTPGVESETLFSKGPGIMDLQLGTAPSGAGGIRFRPRGEGMWDTTGGAFGTNRWQHLVAVYDASGGAVRVYVDGVARSMAAAGVVVPGLTTSTNGLRLGARHDGTAGFMGRLDDVRIYGRALDAVEVRALLASEAAAPLIVSEPQDVRQIEGSRVMVSAGTVGDRPMNFAWSQAGALSVVTTESLNFAALARQDAGLYKLVVTNATGTATSRAFTVDVLYGPEFVFEPTDKSVSAGTTVRLSAGVDGNPTPALQWTRDGRLLPEATNSTLTLAGIQSGEAGVYQLVASNEVGTRTGREVRVGVFYAPQITRQPVALTVDHGRGFEVSVEATGLPVPSFQWFRGVVPLPGATNAALRVASATVADEGEYRVEVRNTLRTIQSDPALVTVRRVAPVIAGLPGHVEVGEGDDVAWVASVEGIPGAVLQWLHQGEALPGETNATLKLVRVREVESGRYALAATNMAGSAIREVTLVVKASGQSLGRALDTSADLAWPLQTVTGWRYQTDVSHDGEDAAQSGKIGGHQTSEMRVPLMGPGSLTFWWRTSCEEGWDYAEVLMDGQRKGRMTGVKNWAAVHLEVPQGLHTVTWRYAKDGSTAEGEDAVWVDEVEWAPEPGAVQSAWVEVLPTSDGGWQVRALGGGTGRAAIQSSRDLETWTDVLVGTGRSGVLRARVEGAEGERFFRVITGP